MQFYPPLSRIAGRYEVASRPLLGGMGVVYLCYDHQDDRPVALKTFKPEYLPDRDARDRFLREGTTWVNLGRHPHVVRAYDVERIGDGREVFLVLEQVAKEPGRIDASLRAWLTPGKPLPVEQALLFGVQIARGLRHAAESIAGFVHRDLKPENVLVGADRLPGWDVNRVRVTDFGLSAVLQGLTLPASGKVADLGRTQLTQGMVGTPQYMAPEQWVGEAVLAATDIYALGCVLFEMLTGEPAAAGRSLDDLRRAHRDGRLQRWTGPVPKRVKQVVERCLQVRAAERYANWGQVELILAECYAESAGRAAPPVEPAQALTRGERLALGWAQSAMGASYMDIGKAEVALGFFERARSAGLAEGERRLESAGLTHLGLAHTALGDARRAIGNHEQALAIDREIGDRGGEGTALVNLGVAYNSLGDARRAIGCHEQALAIAQEIGDRRGEGNALGNLGEAYRNLIVQRDLQVLRDFGPFRF